MTPVEFVKVGNEMRSVYRQLDGTIELADACKCGVRFELDCPIDEHKIKALVAHQLREEPQ